MSRQLFTSESVFKGHPDKVCDQISDGILDEILKQDKFARVAIECAIKDDLVYLFGEVTTKADFDYGKIAVNILHEIGYTNKFNVMEMISEQSPDIAAGVDLGGAGDQGMMFGYACNETEELMPLPIVLAHRIAKRVDEIRNGDYKDFFEPDGKCQVTVEYVDGKPKRIDTIVISAQTKKDISKLTIRNILKFNVIEKAVDICMIDRNTNILINPAGEFLIGGPYADSGLTGRKIIVDTYGGYARHGGGAFSGKDCSKVDRSGAYYARLIAKAVVSARLASRCEVQLAYAIGVAEPVSINVNTFGTGVCDDDVIEELITKVFDCTPSAIKIYLRLDSIEYRPFATYGHMGRVDLEAPWEDEFEKAVALKEAYEEAKRAA